ncbi:MAG TPA: AraC family transcriptional regulator [Phycisphaerales bacterium]|nr:AraC family transcriptional regulator [Phycisphaerales bacterium]
MSKDFRSVWTFQGLPGVVLYESMMDRERTLPAHIHRKDVFQLILSGDNEVKNEISGQKYRLRQGTISLCPSGMALSGRAVGHTLSLVVPSRGPEVRGSGQKANVNQRAVKSLSALLRDLVKERYPEAQRVLFQQAQAYLGNLGLAVPSPEIQPSRSQQEQRLHRIKTHIERDFSQQIQLESLAGQVGWHPHYMQKLFRKRYGITPRRLQSQLRSERALELLSSGQPAAEVAQAVGFCDQSHLIRVFRQFHGVSPGAMMSRTSNPLSALSV